MDKIAGATAYLQEEISDARLYCEEIKRHVVRAIELVNASTHKEHLYAIAGDIVYGVPSLLSKLETALNATAMAVDKIDYEELRQTLKPEKVDELERVLEEVRLIIPRRTGNPIIEGADSDD